jgi:peroxiredoxin Q/BCP
MTLEIGDKAPDFHMPTDNGGEAKLSDYKGQKLVLYFYPKDDTSGCTTQACAFTDNLPDFDKLNCAVLGVSKDSVKKHDKFKEKYNLGFPLASDEEGTTCEDYGVWVEKSMYGKQYLGIERTTFLINEEGFITKIWRKVKVPGHVEEVIEAVS